MLTYIAGPGKSHNGESDRGRYYAWDASVALVELTNSDVLWSTIHQDMTGSIPSRDEPVGPCFRSDLIVSFDPPTHSFLIIV